MVDTSTGFARADAVQDQARRFERSRKVGGMGVGQPEQTTVALPRGHLRIVPRLYSDGSRLDGNMCMLGSSQANFRRVGFP